MTALEMQTAFEIETGIIDSTVKPLSSDIFYWINRAIEKFVKTRYDGNNYKREAFEQNQKRIDDLRTLITESSIVTTTGTIKPNSYIALLPTGYTFAIAEEVDITFINSLGASTTKHQGVTEITSERYIEEIRNPFSEHNLHYEYAKPLRLFYDTSVELISDGGYSIPLYRLRYIKQPTIVALPSTNSDLPLHTHAEIIKIAVSMYLENTKNNRYSTYANEVNTVE